MNIFFLRIVAILLLIASSASAQSVPPLVNYQGRLANPDGSPLPTADYPLAVKLYDSPTNGALVWGPQLFDGTAGPGRGPRIPVVQGWFNLTLGPVDTNGVSLAEAFGNSSRFVEVTVSNRPPVSPRQQILSTPFAMQAGNGSPPGSISAFGGPTVPDGWLLCDGRVASSNQYPRLWSAIATAWGAGYTNGVKLGDFNLPDLRGLFLRGISATSANDPDRDTRSEIKVGGNTNNNVGSFQSSQVGNHTHGGDTGTDNGTLTAQIWINSGGNLAYRERTIPSWTNSLPRTDAVGTFTENTNYKGAIVVGQTATNNPQNTESRPVNAYVNYIIKY